jgi:PKHD-type hydroxylase
MLTQIHNVLSNQALESVKAMLCDAPFVDGKLSAGIAAGRVKHNEEVAADSKILVQLNNLVMGNLVRHPHYKSAALPLRIATPFYSRYRSGMTYGDHIDDPVMGPAPQYRSDIAITIFLSSPESYDGGELVVNTSFGERRVKLPAGDAILYPASSRHRVAEVTRGERLVAVTWVQSMIRDPIRRELLFELNQAREKLLKTAPDADETRQVDQTYVNLVRMWADV